MPLGDKLRSAASKLRDEPERPPNLYVSTGSSLLNLACSGAVSKGLAAGKYYLMVGDSAAGKTFLALTCLAEASVDARFRRFRLIYDNVEDGCSLDIESFFGSSLARRLEPPATNEGEAIYSETVEAFYYHVDDAVASGRPFLYVLDSMDGLTSDEDEQRFDKRKAAFRGGREVGGSYGTSKARRNSEGLRKVVRGLRKTNSILVVLCQTRDDLGFGFSPKTRSGGRALRFYCTVEIWASVVKSLTRSVRGKSRQIAVRTRWQVKKNRLVGGLSTIEFDIYPSYGIDDLGSCVDYLIDEGWWKTRGKEILADRLGLREPRNKLIGQIERRGLVSEVKAEVEACWHEIEQATKLKRQRRFPVASA